jgi:hypothetical protein
MAWHPVKRAVLCPCCGVWADGTLLTCSWCTVELRTGSWRNADILLASRALRRLPASRFEDGPIADLLPDAPPPCGTRRGYRAHRKAGVVPCEECTAAQNAANAEWKRASRARQVVAA